MDYAIMQAFAQRVEEIERVTYHTNDWDASDIRIDIEDRLDSSRCI